MTENAAYQNGDIYMILIFIIFNACVVTLFSHGVMNCACDHAKVLPIQFKNYYRGISTYDTCTIFYQKMAESSQTIGSPSLEVSVEDIKYLKSMNF